MVLLSIPNGNTLSFNVNPNSTTVSAFEQLVHHRIDIPQSFLRHSLRHRIPNSDSLLLSDLGIGRFTTVILHVPLFGGGARKPPPDFTNSNKPPSNYVAGLGRGASGFTTRSDIGPADLPDRSSDADEFEGNDSGLFCNAEYDEDDKEADAVWESVDKRMDSRRKDRREATVKEKIEKHRESNPKTTELFGDLKRKLVTLSVDEWDNIPEIGDYSHKNKKMKKFESFVPIPDTILAKAKALDLTSVGEGRGNVLSLKLDKLSDSVSGQTVVDPKGYLTDLKSIERTRDDEVYDFKRARLLCKSVTNSDPKNPNGWIAAARVEEKNGKLKAARFRIKRGCEKCPKNEDVWIEACRLANPEDAKEMIAKGIRLIPDSVKLWLVAAEMENEAGNKSRVLRKGLERIPDSVKLWKAVVELANEEDARILLHRAVECCPLHLEMWIALARLESYENSKTVLYRAREKLPKEKAIWITAAKLEEANGNTVMVSKIIDRGIKALRGNGVVIDREIWMNEAEECERDGSVATCQAIIEKTIGIGVEEEDRERTWVADAEECKEKGCIETARAIYAHALTVFVTNESIWLEAAEFEKSHGTRESLDALLRKAVTYVPQVEELWLRGAKEKWLAGDVPAACDIIQEAYAAIPDSEEIWLAAFKLEFENNEPERARMLLAKARERGGTERVWMKSAIVERELGNVEEERRLLDEGLKRFPTFFKLWLMLGQLEERFKHLEHAKKAYDSGLKHCPNCIPLWLSRANLEEKVNGLNKARGILITARKKNPRNAELWLAAIRIELRHDNKRDAEHLMSKALQECPKSGILLALDIEMSPRPRRKTKSSDALKKFDKDPHVTAAVAKLFWQDKKVKKARLWFKRAVNLFPPSIGDIWAYYYKFELQHGSKENQKEVLAKCVASEPKHGEKWQAIAKAVENAHQPIEIILKRVVIALSKEDKAA